MAKTKSKTKRKVIAKLYDRKWQLLAKAELPKPKTSYVRIRGEKAYFYTDIIAADLPSYFPKLTTVDYVEAGEVPDLGNWKIRNRLILSIEYE